MSLCKLSSNLLFNYYLHVCVLKRKYCTYLRESTIILLATSRDTVIQLLSHHPYGTALSIRMARAYTPRNRTQSMLPDWPNSYR